MPCIPSSVRAVVEKTANPTLPWVAHSLLRPQKEHTRRPLLPPKQDMVAAGLASRTCLGGWNRQVAFRTMRCEMRT
jgi:hypothetical protein